MCSIDAKWSFPLVTYLGRNPIDHKLCKGCQCNCLAKSTRIGCTHHAGHLWKDLDASDFDICFPHFEIANYLKVVHLEYEIIARGFVEQGTFLQSVEKVVSWLPSDKTKDVCQMLRETRPITSSMGCAEENQCESIQPYRVIFLILGFGKD